MYYCENDTFYGFLLLDCLELSTPSGQKGGSVPVLPVFSTLCKAKECLKIKRVLIKKGRGKPDSGDHIKGFFSLLINAISESLWLYNVSSTDSNWSQSQSSHWH